MKKKVLQKELLALILVFFIYCIVPNVYGSGFGIYTQGASTLGQGAATIAHTDDPSAIFWNPALINKLEGTQIQLGTTLIFPSRKFESDFSGNSFKTEPDVFFPSTFFITHKFNEKVSTGLGVFNPFGLATKWPDDWEGRYLATNSEMTTFNINPVVSFQITPKIAFAAGLDFLLLDATLEKKINLGFADSGQKFEGDGSGVGFNFGIIIEPHKDIAIGASYRSEINVDIDGNVTFDLPDPSLGIFFPNTAGNTDITLPQQVHAGISYKGFNPVTLEVALRWEGWSSYDQLVINLEKPVGPTQTTIFPSDKNWDDTYSFSIGAKYQMNDSITLLAGYLYQGNPIPDDTFEPAIPDANAHLFTVGTSIKHKQFKVDLAYGYQKFQNRNKDNDVGSESSIPGLVDATANGEYKSHLHMVALSFTYMF